jgi:hypothetical protein
MNAKWLQHHELPAPGGSQNCEKQQASHGKRPA